MCGILQQQRVKLEPDKFRKFQNESYLKAPKKGASGSVNRHKQNKIKKQIDKNFEETKGLKEKIAKQLKSHPNDLKNLMKIVKIMDKIRDYD